VGGGGNPQTKPKLAISLREKKKKFGKIKYKRNSKN